MSFISTLRSWFPSSPSATQAAAKPQPRYYAFEIPVSMGYTPDQYRNKIVELAETAPGSNLFSSTIYARQDRGYDIADGFVIYPPAPLAAIFREIDSHMGQMNGWQLPSYREAKAQILGAPADQVPATGRGLHLAAVS